MAILESDGLLLMLPQAHFSRDRYRVLGVRISVKAKANNGVHLIQPPERHRNETERSQADYIRS